MAGPQAVETIISTQETYWGYLIQMDGIQLETHEDFMEHVALQEKEPKQVIR